MARLFCAKMMLGDEIKDVFHVIADTRREVHQILDNHLTQCIRHGILDYDNYQFSELTGNNGYTVRTKANSDCEIAVIKR